MNKKVVIGIIAIVIIVGIVLGYDFMVKEMHEETSGEASNAVQKLNNLK